MAFSCLFNSATVHASSFSAISNRYRSCFSCYFSWHSFFSCLWISLFAKRRDSYKKICFCLCWKCLEWINFHLSIDLTHIWMYNHEFNLDVFGHHLSRSEQITLKDSKLLLIGTGEVNQTRIMSFKFIRCDHWSSSIFPD